MDTGYYKNLPVFVFPVCWRCVVWAVVLWVAWFVIILPYPIKLFNRIETKYIKTMAVLSEFPSCTVMIDEWIHIYIGVYVMWIGVDWSGGSMVWYGMDVQLSAV